jgi:hypothetical protein
LDSL